MTTKLIYRCNNTLTLNSRVLDSIWVYGIYDSKLDLVFMFYGTLKDIIAMRPFKLNFKYDENENYTYVLIQPCKNKLDAENAFNYWLKESELEGSMPPYNVYNNVYNDKYYIQCVENGKFYRSAQDVVKIFGFSQPAVSNHLRGVTGYKHVKGLTFCYYHGDMPDEIELAGGMKLKREGSGHITTRSEDPLNQPNLTERDRVRLIEEMKYAYRKY